eukprot:8175633-Alexandrium_andersonii.AAC.1
MVWVAGPLLDSLEQALVGGCAETLWGPFLSPEERGKLQEVWQNSALQTPEPKAVIDPRAFRNGNGDVSVATVQ